MKKSLVVLCAVAVALAAFAQAKNAAAGKGMQNGARARQGARPQQFQNGAFPMPTTLTIDGNTTAQQIKDFKKQICDKVDAAFKAQSAKTGEAKQPTTVIFFVNEGGLGAMMGGMGGQGFGGAGGMPRGMAPNMMPGAPAK